MNDITCECGSAFCEEEMEAHLVSKEHKKYSYLKKAYWEAVSQKVKTRVAS